MSLIYAVHSVVFAQTLSAQIEHQTAITQSGQPRTVDTPVSHGAGQ